MVGGWVLEEGNRIVEEDGRRRRRRRGGEGDFEIQQVPGLPGTASREEPPKLHSYRTKPYIPFFSLLSQNKTTILAIDQPNMTGHCCYGLATETVLSQPTRTTPLWEHSTARSALL